MVISLVRFKSGLTDEDVQAKFEARADAYESVPGLIEKLYVRYRTGDFGASMSGRTRKPWLPSGTPIWAALSLAPTRSRAATSSTRSPR
jgi:hypothetical protein